MQLPILDLNVKQLSTLPADFEFGRLLTINQFLVYCWCNRKSPDNVQVYDTKYRAINLLKHRRWTLDFIKIKAIFFVAIQFQSYINYTTLLR